MAIKDFGKGLKSSLHDAVDTVKANDLHLSRL